MKIRTITTGFNYSSNMIKKDFDKIVEITKKVKEYFVNNNYVIQTIRISTQPWEDFADNKNNLIKNILRIEKWIKNQPIEYFSIGPTNEKKNISFLPEVLSECKHGFVTVNICDDNKILFNNILETAKAIKKIAEIEPHGFANLRFAALCNVKPHTPFFPASYHKGSIPSFGIGLENSDLVYDSFKNSDSIQSAKNNLEKKLIEVYKPIDNLALSFSKKYNIRYDGIDTSISTSIDEFESVAYSFEYLFDNYKFGSLGTLTISRIITEVLQSLNVRKTGYCGLMLPVLEDHGLALRNKQKCFSITNLLLYSAVCGTGLDTIPLPGNVTLDELNRILLDVASLSLKLNKPLSARLMPIPGKNFNDKTEYNFDYFKNSTVMNPL